jgi:BlaI family penicillinase repressor
MQEYKITDTEAKLADLIWAHEPLRSSDLVKLCEAEFRWKKSTTYTMLKRLEGKELFINNNGVVEALVKKEDFYAEQSKLFVEETFAGSLPRFLAAFSRSKKLTDQEIAELRNLIDEYQEDGHG